MINKYVFNYWVVFHPVNVSHFIFLFPVDGHLGCFQFLLLLNSAGVNVFSLLHMCFFRTVIYSEVELLG